MCETRLCVPRNPQPDQRIEVGERGGDHHHYRCSTIEMVGK
ncbi:hypothetical protein [Haladaptatus pallidirubidus]